MRVQHLRVSGFRNLDNLRLDLSPGFNALVGANGAGKTSILEAIYSLGHGRSFRSRHTDPLIGRDKDEYHVFARGLSASGEEFKLGLARDHHNPPRMHINEQNLGSLAELARRFPVVEIDASSLALLDEGPAQRRNYIDWGVFHVEQSSANLWSRFRRVLLQRNSLLKNPARADWEYWDKLFADLGEQIDRARQLYMKRLMPALSEQIGLLLGEEFQVETQYLAGWRQEEGSLDQQLADNRQREIRLGRTTRGPQHADLRITSAGSLVRDRLSRGQKKLLLAALKFAQVRLYNEVQAESCVLLLDDFPAELDSNSLAKVRGALAGMDCQLVAAAVEAEELAKLNPFAESRVFHVEHGQLKDLNGDPQE